MVNTAKKKPIKMYLHTLQSTKPKHGTISVCVV